MCYVFDISFGQSDSVLRQFSVWYYGPDMSSVLACYFFFFAVNLGVILNKFCRSILYYVSGRFVKDFYGKKELKKVCNFIVFCLFQNLCLQILTISPQVNFYQISLFNGFMKELEEGP